MDFKSLSRYLDASAPAILPLQMVADHRGVTRASIDQMLRIGTLRAIKIGKTWFVDAQSLRELEESERRDVARVRAYLEERAHAGQRSIFYEPVMDIVGLKTRIPAHRRIIGWMLGQISEQTHRESGILLSVLVHRKTAGNTRPGPGFLPLAEGLGYQFTDKLAFVEAQTDRVLKHYRGREH